MYWQLNISTYREGKPECVLIRALDLGKLADGPGKVCQYLKLDKSFYGEDLTKSKRIWLEDRSGLPEKINPSQILATSRIGIDYAGPYWSRRKWRFISAAGIPRPAFSGAGMRAAERTCPKGYPVPLSAGRGSSY
jgi:DNA-3-methyladenine glycosylase